MSALDLAVIALYGAVVLAIGLRAAQRQPTSADLWLAGRALPTWAVFLSMVATELSAATFIGVPHAAFTGSWAYLQLAFGALLAKILLARHVIPLYHRLRVVTVYGFLEDRFGPRSRRAAALCFVVGRVLASGARLFIAALAFSAVTGLRIELAIAVSGGIAGLYTSVGGLRAVIWTDALQSGVFLTGAVVLLAVVVGSAGGGAGEILAWAADGERTRVFYWEPLLSLGESRPFFVGLVGGFTLTLATHATDHDMVQRLLATRDGAAGGRALFWSAILNFPMTVLFLSIGTALAWYYLSPPAYDLSDTSRVVPLFALHELPSGARGLLFAGLFAAAMSSLDSAICAIATTWVVDVVPGTGDDAARVRRMRSVSTVFCGLLIAAAIAMAAYHQAVSEGDGPALSLVELALSSMTVLYGGLLGVFGLGMLASSRGSDASAIAGLAVGAVAGLALFLHPIFLGNVAIAWTWWIPIGATLAFAVVASRPRAPQARPPR